MAEAYVANGATLARGNGSSPEVFTTIPNLTSLTPLGQTRGLIDTSNLSSTSRRYVKAIPDGQEIQLEMQYDPQNATQDALRSDMLGEEAVNFRATLPWVSPAQKVDFPAQVTNWSVTQLTLDNVAMLTVTLKPTGDLVFTP